MKTPSKQVTDKELEILEVLWARGPSTIRAITSILYSEGTTSEYATVQKLLDRLQQKTCVRRSRDSHAHTFTATVNRSDLIGQSLQGLAKQLCSGSLTPLLIHLTENIKLSNEDREKLRQLIDES